VVIGRALLGANLSFTVGAAGSFAMMDGAGMALKDIERFIIDAGTRRRHDPHRRRQ